MSDRSEDRQRADQEVDDWIRSDSGSRLLGVALAAVALLTGGYIVAGIFL
ncbi:hypothetical protein [Isoptericola croceus]|nr:hypothetical protein [Isoptericola croceus]